MPAASACPLLSWSCPPEPSLECGRRRRGGEPQLGGGPPGLASRPLAGEGSRGLPLSTTSRATTVATSRDRSAIPGSPSWKSPSTPGSPAGATADFASSRSSTGTSPSSTRTLSVSRDCLSRCVEALEADAELAGVAPLLMRTDGETVDSAGQVLKSANLEVRDIGYGLPPSPDLLDSRPVLAACGALAVFRTSALAAVADEHGPWAQQYFCFWEDLELGWRLANTGRVVRTVPDAVATHRRGGGAAEGRGPLRWRRPAHLEACMFTNRWMTLIRHLHPLDLAPRLPLLLTWDSAAVAAGAARRPALIGHIKRRWPLVMNEWRSRSRYPRRRLRELI